MSAPDHRWPCTACGADLSYAPGQTALICGHCGHAQTIAAAPGDALGAMDPVPLSPALDGPAETGLTGEVRSVPCPSCGALTEFSGGLHAGKCAFCAAPVALDSGANRRLKPQALLPFDLTEDAARLALGRWLGGLWFAPGGLPQNSRKDRTMSGIFLPFWAFGAATASHYTGQRGQHVTESRTTSAMEGGQRRMRTQRLRRTLWHAVSGQVARDFSDVLVQGTESLPEALGDGLAPWDLGRLVPYSPDFLAGFQAEAYAIALPQAHQSARARMQTAIEADVRRDIGGDAQRIDALDTAWTDERFRHLMLPVWTATYRFGGKTYRFAINGQTGRVQGERPYSLWKIAFAVLAALALIAAVAAAVQLNAPSELGQ